MKHTTYLKKLNACNEAVIWAKDYPTLQKAWEACERGDWMLWLLGKQSGDHNSKSRKKLVLTACKCARLSLKYVEKGEKRPLNAIQTAEKWANGYRSITLQDVRSAAYAAYAAYADYAAYAAYADYAAYAAYAAAADYAAYAAAAYAAAAYAAAAYAAAAYAAYAARTKTLKKCADIVRKDYPQIRMINQTK